MDRKGGKGLTGSSSPENGGAVVGVAHARCRGSWDTGGARGGASRCGELVGDLHACWGGVQTAARHWFFPRLLRRARGGHGRARRCTKHPIENVRGRVRRRGRERARRRRRGPAGAAGIEGTPRRLGFHAGEKWQQPGGAIGRGIRGEMLRGGRAL